MFRYVKSPFGHQFKRFGNCDRTERDTYPQLRQRLEQVKYSSGKKELLAMCSSEMSPLKRSLRA